MIPCHICNKDASTGWTLGFVPALDSQKLALCALHDTAENRERVREAWEAMQTAEISSFAQVSQQKAAPAVRMLVVHFSGGGMLSFRCTAVAPTAQGTLRIEQPDGTQTFIPLQHIREYSTHPWFADDQDAGSAPIRQVALENGKLEP